MNGSVLTTVVSPSTSVITLGEALGDIVFVELRNSNCERQGSGVVEPVKAASDVYSPLSGEVTEINEALLDAPETVNASPYDNGWFSDRRQR